MAYLTDAGVFEQAITRGRMSFRSPRLNAVVAAVAAFVREQTRPNLDALERAWEAWKKHDPKEFADRGAPIANDLWTEVLQWRAHFVGTFYVVDRLSHPEFVPVMWMHPEVQFSTNCYAYALNSMWGHRFGHKPQPGERARRFYEESGPQVQHAVLRDANANWTLDGRILTTVLRQPGEPIFNIRGSYLVALVVTEARAAQNNFIWDYH